MGEGGRSQIDKLTPPEKTTLKKPSLIRVKIQLEQLSAALDVNDISISKTLVFKGFFLKKQRSKALITKNFEFKKADDSSTSNQCSL